MASLCESDSCPNDSELSDDNDSSSLEDFSESYDETTGVQDDSFLGSEALKSLRFKRRSSTTRDVQKESTPKGPQTKRVKVNSAPSKAASSRSKSVSDRRERRLSAPESLSRKSKQPSSVPSSNPSSSKTPENGRRSTGSRETHQTPSGRSHGQRPPQCGRSQHQNSLEMSEGDDEFTDDFSEQPVKSVLGEITNMLGTVIKRLEKTESKLESMERKFISNSSSGSSSERMTKKKSIPKVVRVSISIHNGNIRTCMSNKLTLN